MTPHLSPQTRNSKIREIFPCGIRNNADEFGIPPTIEIQTPKFQCQRLESSTWNAESTAWNPRSKAVLFSLTWGDP